MESLGYVADCFSRAILHAYAASNQPPAVNHNPKYEAHLAQRNGFEHPVEVYLAGEFDDWPAFLTIYRSYLAVFIMFAWAAVSTYS